MEDSIIAFGKKVNREKAIEIITNDYICCIVLARNTNVLEDLLFQGWKGLDEWTDQELEEWIADLLEENQIDFEPDIQRVDAI